MNTRLFPDHKISITFSLLTLIITTLFLLTFLTDTTTNNIINKNKNNLVCTGSLNKFHSKNTPLQLQAILHYATTKTVPQQSLAEISLSFNLLKTISPCNFLVFGLGHDSLMWASFNPGGLTLFLEEDPKWVHTVLKTSPDLKAAHVSYRTRLSQADELMRMYRLEPECGRGKAYVRGNERCKLALSGLPEVVYDKEWDVIMIDAPRGWYADAPGRMGAIYTAAVMGRRRKGSGVTHVFLHDVDRRVEKSYAEEFLCRKYLKGGIGRLWHFEIPPAGNGTGSDSGGFC